MKFYSPLFLFLISVSGLFALTIAPSLSDNQSQSPKRQVRVTTGIGEVQGWEQGLVEKNPNLARWHWDPIYYYKQGYGPVTSKTSIINGRTTGKQSQQALSPSRGNSSYPNNHYHNFKPVHVPYSPQVMADLQGRLLLPKDPSENSFGQKETVLGKLMTSPTGESKIETYGKILPDRKRSVDTEFNYGSQKTAVYGRVLDGNSQKTAVYGEMLNDSSTNTYKNKNIITRKRKTSPAGKVSRSTYDAKKNQ